MITSLSSFGASARMWRTSSTILLAASMAACSRSPSQSILGSYFPSWLLCLVAGIVVVAILRAILFAIGLGEAVFVPLVAYPALALAITFAIWLLWFAN